MAISQFDKYFGNEYVPQVAPVPFDVLMKVGQAKQQDWDTQEKKAQEAESLLGNLKEGYRTQGWGQKIRADYEPRIQEIINADNYADPNIRRKINQLTLDIGRDQRIKTAALDYAEGNKEYLDMKSKDANFTMGAGHKWINPDQTFKQIDINNPYYESYGQYTHYADPIKGADSILGKIKAHINDSSAKGASLKYDDKLQKWMSISGGKASSIIDDPMIRKVVDAEVANFDPNKPNTEWNAWLVASGQTPTKEAYREWLINEGVKYHQRDSKSTYQESIVPGQGNGNNGDKTQNPNNITSNPFLLAPNQQSQSDNDYITQNYTGISGIDIVETNDAKMPYGFKKDGKGMQKLQTEMINTPMLKEAATQYLVSKGLPVTPTNLLDAALNVKALSASNTRSNIVNAEQLPQWYSDNRQQSIATAGDFKNRTYKIEGSDKPLNLGELATWLEDNNYQLQGKDGKPQPITVSSLENILNTKKGYSYAGVAPGSFGDKAGDVLNLNQSIVNTDGNKIIPRIMMSSDITTNKYHRVSTDIANLQKNSDFAPKVSYMTYTEYDNSGKGREVNAPLLLLNKPVQDESGRWLSEGTSIALDPQSYKTWVTTYTKNNKREPKDSDIQLGVLNGGIKTLGQYSAEQILNIEINNLANSPERKAESQKNEVKNPYDYNQP